MAETTPDLTVMICSQCDAVFPRVPVQPGERLVCTRCDNELFRDTRRRYDSLFPIVITALITFFVCNLFPIVEIQVKGLTRQTTLYESSLVLWQDGRYIAALMVFMPTIAFPILEFSLLLFVLWHLRLGRRPPGFAQSIRLIKGLRPWGMLEVFMLGVAAAMVKLATMATLIPGAALWAFGVMTVLVGVLISFDPTNLWLYDPRSRVEPGEPESVHG